MNLGVLAVLWPLCCDMLALSVALLATAMNFTAWHDYRLVEAAALDERWLRTTRMAARRSELRAAVKWILCYAVLASGRMEIKLLITLALVLLLAVLLIERQERAYWLNELNTPPA